MPLLLHYPIWVGTLAVVIILVAVAVLTHIFASRRPRTTDENEVAGVYMLQAGVLYAVLLAFVVVVAWGDFAKAEDTTATEVNALGDLYRTVRGLAASQRVSVRADILSYARLMQTEEWPAMQDGHSSQTAQLLAERIAESVDRFRPRNSGEANTHAAALSSVDEFLDARRQRLNKNTQGIPHLLLWALWIGAVITIGYTAFMRVGRPSYQLAMTIVLAVLIGIVLSLVIEFEYPYRGDVRVSATAWANLEHAFTSGFIK